MQGPHPVGATGGAWHVLALSVNNTRLLVRVRARGLIDRTECWHQSLLMVQVKKIGKRLLPASRQ